MRRVHFFICTNARPDGSPLPCCANRGSADLLTAFQAELTRRRYPQGVKVSGSTCLTTCQHGPTVVVYPEGIWYAPVTLEDVPAVFDAHLNGNAPLEHLLPPKNTKIW